MAEFVNFWPKNV